MPICEMCGSEDSLVKAEIEKTVLTVCTECSKYGTILKRAPEQRKVQHTYTLPGADSTEVLIDNFSEVIKKKRESMNITQEELAKKINEKVSLIHKMETGNFEPSEKLTKKLESFLSLKLIDSSPENVQMDKTKSSSYTLGDFIKVKN